MSHTEFNALMADLKDYETQARASIGFIDQDYFEEMISITKMKIAAALRHNRR